MFCRDFHQTKALDCKALGYSAEISDYYESVSGPGAEITEPEIMALTLARLDKSEFIRVNEIVQTTSEKIDELVEELETRLRM